MDWNAKWDWENLALFNSKAAEVPKQQITNWEVEEGEDIMDTEFRLYEGKGSRSSSELVPDSSARSSISVCIGSPYKEVIKNTRIAFGNTHAFSVDMSDNEDLCRAEKEESPLPLESSVGSGEPLIGLKLGKHMYFENNGFGSSRRTASLPEVPVLRISSIVKKPKSSSLSSHCQVEGCNLDLSSAKEYHRKHRVCPSHSKFPKVVIGGLERRFCQQCSRFHSLSEFDDMKRSCRKRLSDHNARRRKPQLDRMQFNTMSLASPLSAFTCTDGRQEMSFMSTNASHLYSISSNSTWEGSFSSKFTATKGCLLKFEKTEGLDEQLQLVGTELPHAVSLSGHNPNRLLPLKGTKSETSSRGFKEHMLPPNLEPDFHCALSLLSSDSWNSCPQSNNSPNHAMNINHMHHQPLMPGFLQSFPQTSLEFCQTDHHSTDSLTATATANDTGYFQLFKAPYENALYSNLFN